MPSTPPSSPARGVLASWLYTVISFVAVFIVCTIAVVLNATSNGAPGWVAAMSTGTLVGLLFAVSLLRRGLHGGLRGHPAQHFGIALALASSVTTFAYTVFANPDFALGTLPFSMTVTVVACTLRRNWMFVLLGLVTGIAGAQFLAIGAPGGSLTFFMTVFFVFTMYMSMWAWNVVLKLDDARHTEKHLALARERLRFANELHDAQGHTLQVLALKTELAERLLDSNIDAARSQLRDARQLAADALANTRSIARGYQKVAMEDEIRNAVDVLEAAGTTCSLDLEQAPTTDSAKELFARLVREGTTNLLRHATDATHASIVVTGDSTNWIVRMRNNGVDEAALASTTGGSGIAGLHAAFREATGEVTGTLDQHEFILMGRLPR